jgi:hypothetical protein
VGALLGGMNAVKNNYEIRGDVTAIFLKSDKYGDMETIISTDKLEVVKKFENSWYPWYHKHTDSFYVRGNTPCVDGTRKTITMHRFITGDPKGMVVDHFNHDTLDNTDFNLRIATTLQNNQNTKGARRNNISGVRGVTWDKTRKKWLAKIEVNGTQKRLGRFKTIEEAQEIVVEARKLLMPYCNESA